MAPADTHNHAALRRARPFKATGPVGGAPSRPRPQTRGDVCRSEPYGLTRDQKLYPTPRVTDRGRIKRPFGAAISRGSLSVNASSSVRLSTDR